MTKPVVAIETGYSAGDDGVKPEVRVEALQGPVEGQTTLPPHTALGAPHPGDAPDGAVRGHLERFEGYLADHRECAGLAGSILEVTSNGAVWGVAWMRCPECGVRWERRLALNGSL